MSYAVSQRTPEIAVRLALGAPARAIAASVIGRSVGLAAIGASLGLAGALALAQAMRSVLFGVTATDPADLPRRRGAGAGRGGRRRLAADAPGRAGRSDSESAAGLRSLVSVDRVIA